MLCSAARLSLVIPFVGLLAWGPATAWAEKPSVKQAMRLSSIQKGVDFDRPNKNEIAKCTIKAETIARKTGWTVRDQAGQVLRRFVDTNRDNKVDQWCYYKNGIEVYRDIDANFNGKADQYRWLGTAGSRWGLDRNEDGIIDSWKIISAEEVSAEVVAALRDKDSARFKRLLLTASELKALGLGKKKAGKLSQKVAAAARSFAALAKKQTVVSSGTKWIHFGATQPGVVSAGTDGSTKDLTVYENVAAVVQTGEQHSQVQLGTLLRVGQSWRIIDLPALPSDQQVHQAAPGFFYEVSLARRPDVQPPPAGSLDKETVKLIGNLEAIDKDLIAATSARKKADLNAKRADAVQQLIKAARTKQERISWIRQLADTVNAAVQSGDYPGGIKLLKRLHGQLARNSKLGDTTAYVKFRLMTAEYSSSIQKPKADFAKIQAQWLKDLEKFVDTFSRSPDAAEAMLQLAVAQEFAGKLKEAKAWYSQIVDDFPQVPLAKKAAGAKRRLDSVGKTMRLKGLSIQGKAVDLASYRGKTVLIHYWATWCEPCKQDLEVLRQMQAKYGSRGFALVGVTLDSDRQTLIDYLAKNRLPWPQLHEEGGLESRLATEMGILTLPTMILVDGKQQVINRNIHATQLDDELKKQLK